MSALFASYPYGGLQTSENVLNEIVEDNSFFFVFFVFIFLKNLPSMLSIKINMVLQVNICCGRNKYDSEHRCRKSTQRLPCKKQANWVSAEMGTL